MTSNEMPATLQELLGQDNFVRQVARSLLFDEHQVDDVVQATWTSVLESPPKIEKNARGWLRAVVRNFVHQSRRKAIREEKREKTVARHEALSSTAEIVERESVRKEIVEAVLSLEEPYRSTILSRFYHDLPPREIAEALSIPVTTVNTRLRRGLDQLRTKLDKSHHDDRRVWCLGLIPFAAKAKLKCIGDASMGTFGGAAQQGLFWKPTFAVSTILLVGATTLFLVLRTGTPTVQETASLPTLTPQKGSQAESGLAAIQFSEERQKIPTQSPATDGWNFSGKVTVKGEKPVTSVTVHAQVSQGGEILWSSETHPDENGDYHFRMPWLTPKFSFTPAILQLSARAPGYYPRTMGRTFEEFPEKNTSSRFLVQESAGGVSFTLPEARAELVSVQSSQENSFNFTLYPGITLTGKVFDNQGNPVIRPRIKICDATRNKELFSYSVQVSGNSYEIYFPERDLTKYCIIALHPAFGMGSLSSVSTDSATLPDIALAGAGILEGRANLPDGTPAEGVILRAYLDSIASREGQESSYHLGESSYIEYADVIRGKALQIGEVTTDAAGRFRFLGLQNGNYRIESVGKNVQIKGKHVYETGQKGIQIEVERYRILVDVKDVQGKRVPGASIQISYLNTKLDEAGEKANFVIPRGESARVRVAAQGAYPESKTLSFKEGQYDLRCPVTLRAVKGSRTVKFKVHDSEGKSIKAYKLVLSQGPKLIVKKDKTKQDPDEFPVEVDSGVYIANVEADEKVYAIAHQEIEIGESEEISIDLRLDDLTGLVVECNVRAGRKEQAEVTTSVKTEDGSVSFPPTVTITPGLKATVGLTSSLGLVSDRAIDRSSSVFRPGSKLLVTVEAPGYITVEKSVVVEKGKITRVSVELVPE